MKCAIFLLALCALEMVFAANFVLDLNSLHQKYTIKLKAVMASFNIYLQKTIKEAEVRNERVSQCREEYQILEQYHQARITHCIECYRKALVEHMNIEVADQCYNANFLALQNKGLSRRYAVKACIKHILAGLPYFPRHIAGQEAGPSTSH